MQRVKASIILRILLIVEMVAILAAASYNSIDYQDAWILEGLELPFALLMATYAVYFYVERKIAWILLFALIFGSVLILIPNVKYKWFLGATIDQHAHYRLAQDIYDNGSIPTDRTYSDTPIMHLQIAIFSIFTGTPVLVTFKFLPILWQALHPLAIYSIMRNLGLQEKAITKYAIFLSSLIVINAYLITGTLFGSLITLLIVAQFIKILNGGDRISWSLFVFYVVVLVVAHTSSSILLAISMTVIFIANGRFPRLKIKYGLYFKTLMLIAVMNFAWLFFEATYLYNKLLDMGLRYLFIQEGGETAAREALSGRFFSLNIPNALRVITVFNGATLFLLFLSSIGIAVAIMKWRSYHHGLNFLILYMFSFFLLMVVLLANLGEIGYSRPMELALVVSPILVSILFDHFDGKKGVMQKLPILIISSIMILATIQFYAYQPLLPSANTISKDLPATEPITYINIVNSVYQRSMISHAERYIQSGSIVCDRVTQNQMRGLASYNYSEGHVIWGSYPFWKLVYSDFKQKQYDYFLIHIPGKSGGFEEKAETHTSSLIVESTYLSSVLYSNRESFILTKPFMFSALLNKTANP